MYNPTLFIYLSSSNKGTYMYFLNIPSFFLEWHTPHPGGMIFTYTNRTPTLVCHFQHFIPRYLYFWQQLPTPPHMPFQDDVKPIRQTSHMPTAQHLRENSKSASTERGTTLEGNAARMKNGNLYRDTGSVYFYLKIINLPSH